MKILKVFVHDETDEEVAAGLLLLRRRELVYGLGQHGVGGPIADVADEILFDPRQRPGFADRGTTLGHHAVQRYRATDGNSHATVLINIAVEINLRQWLGEIAAGKAAIHRQTWIILVPRAQPGFRVH